MIFKQVLGNITAFCLFGSIFSIVSASEPTFRKSDTEIFIDNNAIEATVMLGDNNSEWLPIEDICDYLGYDLNIDEATNIITITQGKNCKNSEGICDKVVFKTGSEEMTMYSREYENKIENAFTHIDDVYQPMNRVADGRIYVPAYYLCRALNLNFAGYTTEPAAMKIYTQNYIYSVANEYVPQIIVTKNLDILIDGEAISLNSKPFIDNSGRTLVPVREFAEFIGKSIYWFGDNKTVCISNVPSQSDNSAGGDSIWFTVGENRYRVNGTYHDIDTSAQIIDNRIYVPLRILAEFFGYNIVYMPASSQ